MEQYATATELLEYLGAITFMIEDMENMRPGFHGKQLQKCEKAIAEARHMKSEIIQQLTQGGYDPSQAL